MRTLEAYILVCLAVRLYIWAFSRRFIRGKGAMSKVPQARLFFYLSPLTQVWLQCRHSIPLAVRPTVNRGQVKKMEISVN